MYAMSTSPKATHCLSTLLHQVVSCPMPDPYVSDPSIIRDLKHRQRNARRRPSQPKEDCVEGFVLVVLKRRRVLVLRLVALAMAFKNVRNLLLINHNDGDEFSV